MKSGVKQISGERPANPSNAHTITVGDKTYIPMSAPQQKLWAPEIPGWHLHWMRGNRQRISQAFAGGYQFVTPEELAEVGGQYATADLAGDAKAGGSTDMGSRVSIVSGDEFGPDGQAERLYLMKCPEEVWRASQAVLQKRIDSIAEAIRGGAMLPGPNGEVQGDASHNYGGMRHGEAQVGIVRRNPPQHLFVKKHS